MIRRQKIYRNSARLPQLETELAEAERLRDKCLQIQVLMRRLTYLDFLQDLDFDASQFRLAYSLSLTQNQQYSQIFRLYLELTQNELMKCLDWQIDYTKKLLALGMRASNELYEYWVFFSILRQLQELHFSLEDTSALDSLINSDVLDARLQAGSKLTLIGEPNIYGDCRVTLFMTIPFMMVADKSDRGSRPDVTMRIQHGRSTAHVAIDAKYKTYNNPSGINSRTKDGFEKDFDQCVSSQKEVKPNCIGAFILHLSPASDMKNYGALIKNIEGKWECNGHRYGYIPFIPGPGGSATNLRVLLSMIFMVKLEMDLKFRWACGSTDVSLNTYKPRGGSEKRNHKVCGNCGNEWWLNRCGCGFPLYKGNLSFQIEHENCPKGGGNYFCSGCGRCYCGARTIEVII